jgi:hypothetical protein
LVFEKNANFVSENRRKSQEILITTSTPDPILQKYQRGAVVITLPQEQTIRV